MNIDQFDFELPNELIAQKRSCDSKMLVFEKSTKRIYITDFSSIIDILDPKDCLIMNNTKVIPSRINAKKQTGARVEIFVEKIIGTHHARVMTQSNHKLKLPATLILENNETVDITATDNSLIKLATFNTQTPLRTFLDKHGSTPLPHYIKSEDRIDHAYQTCFAEHEGAVAAPTAGLHFTDEILNQLPCPHDFITLHVGLGTFLPVKSSNITDHTMHLETYHIKQNTLDLIHNTRVNQGRVVAVGTTSVRTLEDTWQQGIIGPGTRNTDIFIYPNYNWKITDVILTNFHLPKSTLFMLICAAIGIDEAHECYQFAIQHKMRFYSYGDAMLII